MLGLACLEGNRWDRPEATGSRGASGRDGDGEVTRDRLEPVEGECVQAQRRRQATEQVWAEVEVAAA